MMSKFLYLHYDYNEQRNEKVSSPLTQYLETMVVHSSRQCIQYHHHMLSNHQVHILSVSWRSSSSH